MWHLDEVFITLKGKSRSLSSGRSRSVSEKVCADMSLGINPIAKYLGNGTIGCANLNGYLSAQRSIIEEIGDE
jgi:hypothetical protein